MLLRQWENSNKINKKSNRCCTATEYSIKQSECDLFFPYRADEREPVPKTFINIACLTTSYSAKMEQEERDTTGEKKLKAIVLTGMLQTELLLAQI